MRSYSKVFSLYHKDSKGLFFSEKPMLLSLNEVLHAFGYNLPVGSENVESVMENLLPYVRRGVVSELVCSQREFAMTLTNNPGLHVAVSCSNGFAAVVLVAEDITLAAHDFLVLTDWVVSPLG